MNWRVRRMLGWDKPKAPVEKDPPVIMDVEWERSEELRPDRLGPDDRDIVDPERVSTERWRPRRTLGGL